MRHLTDEERSAFRDGALEGRAREDAARHLESCAECRAALEALAAQDDRLHRALVHDPGDAYFEDFAARVEARVRAERLTAPAPGRRPFWSAPRALVWAGGIAAVVAGIGIAFMTAREPRPLPGANPALLRARDAARAPADHQAPATGQEQAPGAPATEPATRDERALSGAEGARRGEAPSASRGRVAAPPGRAQLAPQDELNESRPYGPAGAPAPQFAAPPAADRPPGPVTVEKRERAVPMQAKENAAIAPAPAPSANEPTAKTKFLDGGAPAPEMARLDVKAQSGAGNLCGQVVDHAGRPVAGASVVLAESGANVTTDARGSFCIPAAPGSHTLQIMAIGFQPARRQVAAGSGSAGVRVALDAVSALDGAKFGFASPPAGAGEASFPDSLRGGVLEARALTALAERRPTTRAWERAAESWGTLAAALGGGPALPEARWQIALARWSAWRLDPTTERRGVAAAAVDLYLAVAPAGTRRDQARGWREQLGG